MFERRKCERACYCRSCNARLERETEVIYMYSFRNQGQNIFLCLPCSVKIGEAANA